MIITPPLSSARKPRLSIGETACVQGHVGVAQLCQVPKVAGAQQLGFHSLARRSLDQSYEHNTCRFRMFYLR